MGHSSGVLTAWEQDKGHLLVGGDMKVVRLWDATVERHLRVSCRTQLHPWFRKGLGKEGKLMR